MVEREGGSIWRYYSLTRVHLLVPDAMAPPPNDHLNKAVALFRFLVGILPRGDQAGTGPTIRMTDKAGVGNAGRA
jgi:hypothetical protein